MLSFNFSGNYEDYKNLLRKFTLDQLLLRINTETSAIFRNEEPPFTRGVKHTEFPLINSSTRAKTMQSVYVTGWNLIDLAYNAICCSNDFRGKTIESDNELYLLVSATDSVHQLRESVRMDSEDLHEQPNLFLYVWGFFGEQMKMEAPGKVFSNLSRELYILLDVAKKIDNIPNIPIIVQDEVGVSLENVLTSLFLTWFASTLSASQDNWEQNFIWNDQLPLEDYRKVLSRYTATYSDVRNSTLKRQFLYTKPYIMTTRKQVLSVNCYLNFFLIEHCILWIVRDYYLRLGDQQFTSDFGKLFELYFQELMQEYLAENQFEKIPEKSEKRADWKLLLGEYKLLIEQKSPLLGLLAKQQESDIGSVKTFCERNIIKAIRQLYTTERDYKDGPYIKVILLYEDYLQTNILDHVFSLSACEHTNDGYYWLMTIDEFETLLYTYKNDQSLFSAIMEEKIHRELTQSKDGKSISQVFSQYEITENQHLTQKKFKHHLDRLKQNSLAVFRKDDILNI